uniref:Uncharacterized protein n=1 Tax=Tanacetum cinerariifolium TaxID=118510 RepID=A0A6L2KC58_TANCI|nr:hypothetical protein [Tanacetum cinerariifolium]
MEDVSNQGRMIDELDRNEDVELMGEKEVEKKVEEAKDITNHPLKVLSMHDEPDEVKEIVEIVITAKLITEVTAASTPVSTASVTVPAAEPQVPATTPTVVPDKGKAIMVEEPKPIKKKQQVKMDEELDYFKGISYNDIHPIFEAMFNTNIEFLLKSKEKIEEEDNRAIESINETPSQKVAKRRKLNEEVKKGEIDVFANIKDDDSFPFIFVIQFFLPFLIYPEVSSLLLFIGSEDTIFDPGIST